MAVRTSKVVHATPGPRATRRTAPTERRRWLRLMPSPEALLHPKVAEALVLGFRPLSPGR